MNKNKILERKEIHVKFSVTKDCGHVFLKSELLLLLLLLLLLSHFSRVRLCVTPWTAAHQAPPPCPRSWIVRAKWITLVPPGSQTPTGITSQSWTN